MLSNYLFINVYKTQDKHFYSFMGKYFASREIAKELDNQIYNEENTTWFVHMDNEEEVRGFVSMERKKDHVYLDNFYVLKEHRGTDVGTDLLNYVLEDFKNETIKLITRNEIALKMFTSKGFETYRKNGRYHYMSREPVKAT